MDQQNIAESFSEILIRFKSMPLLIRIPAWILLWPILVGVNLMKKPNGILLRVIAALLIVALFQYQWLAAFYSSLNNAKSSSVSTSSSPSASAAPSQSNSPNAEVLNPIIDISYSGFQSNCNDSYMSGTISVANNGNVPTSGRISVPVSSFEKYEIPLSGIFLSISPGSQSTINLKSDFECKEGQLFGTPRVDFTFPNSGNSAIGVKTAFEWSNFSYRCDVASEYINFKATVKNISEKTISAGVIAHLSTDEVNYTINYWSPINGLKPQESRDIDFGFSGLCNLKRGGTAGPYEPSFEVIYSY